MTEQQQNDTLRAETHNGGDDLRARIMANGAMVHLLGLLFDRDGAIVGGGMAKFERVTADTGAAQLRAFGEAVITLLSYSQDVTSDTSDVVTSSPASMVEVADKEPEALPAMAEVAVEQSGKDAGVAPEIEEDVETWEQTDEMPPLLLALKKHWEARTPRKLKQRSKGCGKVLDGVYPPPERPPDFSGQEFTAEQLTAIQQVFRVVLSKDYPVRAAKAADLPATLVYVTLHRYGIKRIARLFEKPVSSGATDFFEADWGTYMMQRRARIFSDAFDALADDEIPRVPSEEELTKEPLLDVVCEVIQEHKNGTIQQYLGDRQTIKNAFGMPPWVMSYFKKLKIPDKELAKVRHLKEDGWHDLVYDIFSLYKNCNYPPDRALTHTAYITLAMSGMGPSQLSKLLEASNQSIATTLSRASPELAAGLHDIFAALPEPEIQHRLISNGVRAAFKTSLPPEMIETLGVLDDDQVACLCEELEHVYAYNRDVRWPAKNGGPHIDVLKRALLGQDMEQVSEETGLTISQCESILYKAIPKALRDEERQAQTCKLVERFTTQQAPAQQDDKATIVQEPVRVEAIELIEPEDPETEAMRLKTIILEHTGTSDRERILDRFADKLLTMNSEEITHLIENRLRPHVARIERGTAT